MLKCRLILDTGDNSCSVRIRAALAATSVGRYMQVDSNSV